MAWKKHPENSRVIRAKLPYQNNGCTAIALARALVDDPTNDIEVRDMAELVHDQLPHKPLGTWGVGMDPNGSWWGGTEHALQAVGITGYTHLHARPVKYGHRSTGWWGDERPVAYYPTCATFFRWNPEIQEAVIHTDGHTAYYNDGIGFACNARHRVLEVFILRCADLRTVRARNAAARYGLSIAEWETTYVNEVKEIYS